MKRFIVFLFLMFASIPVFATTTSPQVAPTGAVTRPNICLPTRHQTSPLSVVWKQCVVVNGGARVPVAANTSGLAVTLSKTDCSQQAATSTTCNIIFVNSTGTVANTSTWATAQAADNTIIALVTSDAVRITDIVYPQDIAATAPIVVNGGAHFVTCGVAVGVCTGTEQGAAAIVVFGTGITAAGILSITGLPFTSASSYGCSVTSNGLTAAIGVTWSTTHNSGSNMIVRSSGLNQASTGGGSAATAESFEFVCRGTENFNPFGLPDLLLTHVVQSEFTNPYAVVSEERFSLNL